MPDLAKRALAFASRKHASQVDKLGYPYTAHVCHVGRTVAALGQIFEAVGYLHDIVEDCDVNLDVISEKFGPDVGAGVAAMTRYVNEEYDPAYLHRLMENPIAVYVKYADARHNYGKIHLLEDEGTCLRLRVKYEAVFAKLEDREPSLHSWGAVPNLVFHDGSWERRALVDDC